MYKKIWKINKFFKSGKISESWQNFQKTVFLLHLRMRFLLKMSHVIIEPDLRLVSYEIIWFTSCFLLFLGRPENTQKHHEYL